MSSSPPKDLDVDGEIQSPDEMDRDQAESSQQPSGFDFEVKEQDRWLPIANVARIMKTALPDNAKIAKEAKECMQECVSEFISFITSEASEKCQHEKRKTVNGEDILFAMTSLGFENYAEALKIYLAKYRERNSAEGGQRSGSGNHGGAVASASGTITGTERQNQTLTPPMEGEEIQAGYGDMYGGVTGNGGEAAL
ncbi:histone-fold-containing protein [Peziza echinospora]|nr:histone-fold-containing protein [Peziza echinospora]